MRLADFIEANIELILAEWEVFARKIWPHSSAGAVVDPATLRDDAEDILLATVSDMRSDQTTSQQSEKSKGGGLAGKSGDQVNKASELHGAGRVGSGFQLWAVVAEYRALRASVLRLWRESGPETDLNDIDDVTRFNECIDQSLTESVRAYTKQVERDRVELLVKEQAARKDAENANRAKDLFLATLSHELRTPLNAIVGWINILRLSGDSEENLAEGLDVIERNTKAQVQLIEDVLDVSRIVSGKLRLDIRDCDLIDIINAGIDVVRPTANAKEISLEVQLDPTARRASCDATRMQQVVWNLLTNALKFTGKRGVVRVTLARESSCLRLMVSDNGQGISPELLPYVFERFRQADSSTRRTYGGLGLGLSIVKHLAEMHGGTVEAQSGGEGQGATFIVSLPIKAVQIAEAAFADSDSESDATSAMRPPEPPPVSLDGLHVLIVDDEPDARRMLSKVLEGVGARVTTAATAAEALAVIANATDKLDVFVSDVGMPNQNGYDLIREVRRLGHHAQGLPAVALTAFAHKDDASEAAMAGFQVHLAKPVNLHELTAVIARLAGRV
ncbi:hybrid sensor histidine kinase/response regulator [Anatilimnocola floriformis]|uniref:hybrid sensor histidine kinase/response regulator n=1 Tax=Anatilimnocola floriformis TaxID=2948575 RepID=UPI0020C26704|nr:hybrid sensor histidine kinase/response regulator [Anatilimnocola floriformis]